MSKNKSNVDSEGFDNWRWGHKSGTREAFAWCAERARELAAKANTDDGRKAMGFIAQLIETESSRRYPPKDVDA